MEITPATTAIQMSDASHVGEARRAVLRWAEFLRFGEERVGAAGVVATELATNIIKHVKEGKILVQGVADNGHRGLQILAIDQGVGIRDVPAALTDGWSTSGTLGGGLGAIRRMADGFDLYTADKAGTIVLCELWREGEKPSTVRRTEVGILSTPFPGETANGDGWAVRSAGPQMLFMVVDGLGHGELASDAAREAERIVRESSSYSPGTLVHDCHDALAKTRGAAIGVAVLNSDSRLVTFAGMGNVAGSISTAGASRGLASHNGTLGHVAGRIQEFTYPWEQESLLILHSDGVTSRWNLDGYPGIRARHPSIVAAVLYRDFGRARDDATILVARNSLN
jgi:anti-sigma regulatory factor (Ser/Thr protein kinase)